MSRRLKRAKRLARLAQQAEDVAGAALLRGNQRLQQAESRYQESLRRAAGLRDATLSPGMRAALITSGSQAQMARAAQRDRLRFEVAELRSHWEDAKVRTKSMEKLMERAITERDERRWAAERAELTDVIAGRLAWGLEHEEEAA